jgi:uncharacterized repeat protein (TIGR03803 family)
MKGCATRSTLITLARYVAALALFGCNDSSVHFPASSHSAALGGDGAVPSGPLTQAADGYFYGTTASGGRFNHGTVFRIGFDGSESVLYSFSGGTNDGADPGEGVIIGSDGNLYGTTRSGGVGSCGGQEPSGFVVTVSTCGTVFEMNLAGSEQVLHFFQGGDDGGVPMTRLVQTSGGNLFGTTAAGGTFLSGTVFQIAPTGAEHVLYDFGASGPADAVAPAAGLILAADGNLYGTTAVGGTSNQGTVFSVTLTGAEAVLASFAPAATGATPTQSLLQASDGNFYGTTSTGGLSDSGCAAGCGTVFQITPSGALTTLYQFGSNVGDGVLPSSALIQASDGNLYGTTRAGGDGACSAGCGTVFKVTPAGEETVLYAFRGADDGAAPQATLIQASDGALYGTTSAGGTFDLGTAFRITLAGVETVLHSFGSAASNS